MTECEAIELLKGMQNELQDYADIVGAPYFASGFRYVYPDPEDYAIEEAIKALEGIQQYREMEHKLQRIYGENNELLGMVVDQLCEHESVDIPEPVVKSKLLTDSDVDKWEQYKEIGTVDECREAREKQIPKVPDIEGDGYDEDGELLYDTWICPDCGKRYEIDYDNYEYCPKCGQHIERGWWNDQRNII